MPIKKYKPNSISVKVALSTAIGMSAVLTTINPTNINEFKVGDITHSHHHEETVVNENQRLCSRCGKVQPLGAFYSKGKRIDSRCKQCVLAVKKSKSAEKRRLKKRKQRGRVLNVDSFQVTISPLRDIEPEHVEDFFQTWIDLALGG